MEHLSISDVVAERKSNELENEAIETRFMDEADSETAINFENMDESGGNGGSEDEEPIESETLDRRERLLPELTLLDSHRQQLKESGLSDEIIAAANFKSVNAEQARQFLFPPLSGLLIPYPNSPLYFRLRPDDPPTDDNGKGRKYLSIKGSVNQIYVPPGFEELFERDKAFVIVEGEKKALKAVQEGFATIGISGVFNWRSSEEGMIPELKQLVKRADRVHIVFDSDLRENSQVIDALIRLTRELEDRLKVDVRVPLLPAGPDGGKLGLDDYFVREGDSGPGKFRALLDGSSELVDSLLQILEPELSTGEFERRLNDIYRAAKEYPSSIAGSASKIRERIVEIGRQPLTSREIVSQIRKVEPLVCEWNGEPKVRAIAFRDSYAAVDDLTDEDSSDHWGFVRDRDGNHDRITNFTVRVIREIEVLDDLDPTKAFQLRIAGPGGVKFKRVTGAQYAEPSQLRTALLDACGAGLDWRCTPEELRSAIASMTLDPDRTPSERSQITTNFGWHESGNFLVPGGFIDEDGFHEGSHDPSLPTVDLIGGEQSRQLGLKALPESEVFDLKKFIGTRFIELQPHVITYACLAMIPLAILYDSLSGYNRFALWLLGRSGTGKSFLGRLMQQFFGDYSNTQSIVTWGSTANYIQREGYFFRNALYVVDDYKPVAILPREVTRILQNYADNTGRGRLQKDATANQTRPIRGMLLSTGEDLPENSASTIARTIVLKIPKMVVDTKLGGACLKRCQDFPALTADLIAHLINQNWLEEFQDLVDEKREHFCREIRGRDNATRIAGNIAMLSAAFAVFAGYMCDVWDYPEDHVAEFDRELMNIRDDMIIQVGEQSASQLFLRQLRGLLDSGQIRIPDDKDYSPLGGDSHVPTVGCRLGTGEVGLFMEAAMKEVNESLRSSGHTLGCTKNALLDQLEEDGLLRMRAQQKRAAGEKLPRMAVLSGKAELGIICPADVTDARNQEMHGETIRQLSQAAGSEKAVTETTASRVSPAKIP